MSGLLPLWHHYYCYLAALCLGVWAGAPPAASGCLPHDMEQLQQCLGPIKPLLLQPDLPTYHTCRTILTFISCVGKKQHVCRDFIKKSKVLQIAADLELRYCDSSDVVTTPAPTTTTTPPPTVHDLFDSCREQFKSSSHRTLRQACRAASRFLQCGQSVLWSHHFSLVTFQLHAELLRNRAVYWQLCARRALIRGGMGRGLCPYDVTTKLASCLNATYWQPVVPGDIKTFCRVMMEVTPCLSELANGCHHVPLLQDIADFLWSSFRLFPDHCHGFESGHSDLVYDYGDYYFDPMEFESSPPEMKPTTASPKHYKPFPVTPSPLLHKAKPPEMHPAEPAVVKMKSSNYARGQNEKNVFKVKPSSANRAESSKNKHGKSAQQAEKSFAKDEHEMVSSPRSNRKDLSKDYESKPEGGSDSSSDCNDKVNKEHVTFPEKKDKSAKGSKHNKPGITPPCRSRGNVADDKKQASANSGKKKPTRKKPYKYRIRDKGQTNGKKEQLSEDSSQNNIHTTLPASSKLARPVLPTESATHLPHTTLTRLLTTDSPTKFQKTQPLSYPSVQTSEFSTQATSPSTDADNSTSSVQSTEIITDGHPDDGNNGGQNSQNYTDHHEEGRDVDSNNATTVAGKLQAETPAKVYVAKLSTPRTSQENRTVLAEREGEEVTGSYESNNISSLSNRSDSQNAATRVLNMTLDFLETNNITIQKNGYDGYPKVSDDSEDEKGRNKDDFVLKPIKIEKDKFSNEITVSPSSLQIKENSNDSRPFNKDSGDQIPPVSVPISIQSSNKSSETMAENNQLNVTNYTLPTTDSSADNSSSQFFTNSSTVSPESAAHSFHPRNVSLESGDTDSGPHEESSPVETPANSNESGSGLKIESDGWKQSKSDANVSEISKEINRHEDSVVVEKVNSEQPKKKNGPGLRKGLVNPQRTDKEIQTKIDQNSRQNENQTDESSKKNGAKQTTIQTSKPDTTTAHTSDTTTTTTTTKSDQTSEHIKENDRPFSTKLSDIEPSTPSIQLTAPTPSEGKKPKMPERPEAEEERNGPDPTAPAVQRAKEEGSEGQRPERPGGGMEAAPWGENCSQPWEGHSWCTAIMMKAHLVSSNQVCRRLQRYIVCLDQLLKACPEFQPFETIKGTLEYVTGAFHFKCPDYHQLEGQQIPLPTAPGVPPFP